MNTKDVRIKINIGNTYEIVEVCLDFNGRPPPILSRFYEDSEYYYVHEWKRLNGTVESYGACLKEAFENGLN
jgi:hypothetical protein